MSDYASYMRGCRGKARLSNACAELQRCIVKRNERIKVLEAGMVKILESHTWCEAYTIAHELIYPNAEVKNG